MLWFVYNFLFTIGFIILLPRAVIRMWRRGGYVRNFNQRFACYSEPVLKMLSDRGRIWIHAVSVGEIFVALQLMRELRLQRSNIAFVLSTTTSTGYALATDALAAPDVLIYLPVDFPFIMKQALSMIQPKALVLVECELWPNLIRLAKRRSIPVMLINGRISDHSFNGYRKLRMFTRPLLAQVDLLCVQSEDDRQKLCDLGADPTRVHVVGSAKYDTTLSNSNDDVKIRALLKAVGMKQNSLVLLGGSTWAGEEEALLDAYMELCPAFDHLLLVLVPRHAERCDQVLSAIVHRKLTVVRRTEVKSGMSTSPNVLLVDTTGELRSFYACADVIFVGKSLTAHGGQNIVEPALCGKPIVVGPYLENFAALTKDFLSAGALLQVRDEVELRNTIRKLLSDPAQRMALGEKAQRLVLKKRGAIRKTIDLISAQLP